MGSKNLGIDEKLFNNIIGIVEEMPFYNLLGIKMNEVGPGYAKISVTTNKDHANHLEMVHGGLLLTMADSAMGNAIRSLGILAVTVDLSTSIMAPGPVNEEIVARGKVVKAGRTMIFAESRVYAGDKLLVDTRGTFYKTGDIEIKE